MERYFFDVENGDGFTRDELGRELELNLEIANEIAKIVMDIAGDELNGSDNVRIQIFVRGENDRPIAVSLLTFTTHWAPQTP
jgi:hypothetical protein